MPHLAAARDRENGQAFFQAGAVVVPEFGVEIVSLCARKDFVSVSAVAEGEIFPGKNLVQGRVRRRKPGKKRMRQGCRVKIRPPRPWCSGRGHPALL